ncbi:hypothetical protein NE619_12660 [Anaerovorax odorimutans]|uniref:DUF2970 domain-containing protein n=1 Tax=Anaerovorax odorimutans TaxID=109327 RepID=A0ABT1RQV7_9FIRM|nr:hypothetical protein [Anaerovorax odorimutans]MCQ4637578.1 hypothetical protein [Anaerovorax odorimutans]
MVISLIFFAMIVSSIVWFVKSLINYRKTPESDVENRKLHKKTLISSLITMCVVVASVTALVITFVSVINNM